MSPALVGLRGARLALWVAVLSVASIIAGCSPNPASAGLEVDVVLESGLISRCVKVTATDGTITRETKPIPLAGKMSPLHIGVQADGMKQPVTVQAFGYSDEGCTTLTPGEESEKKEGSFTAPPMTVTLTLRPSMNGDGGFDGGPGDGGTDAGVDGGFDAGVDMDMDGTPLPADCDDTNPAIHPGVPENCSNGIDDNCDNISDCQQSTCAGMACAGGGTCMSNVCVALTEAVCNDGLDNDNDGLIDCADPECPVNQICSDNNACTLGDRCVADGGCEKLMDMVCNTPPAAQCWVATGTCMPDAGATCVYTQMSGSCNDGLGCTDSDTCSSGNCAGTPKTCNTPPGACFSSTGTCAEPAGTCNYVPLQAGTGTCSDGNNCTVSDSCAGDGGCAGTQVTCTPNQCQNASTSCDADGGCIFPPRTGMACDAGTGAGTCDGTATCNPNPVTLFPTPPSNFTESQLPADGGTTGFNVTCATTLTTGATPAITNGACVTMPAHVVLTSQTTASESTLLIRVPSLTVASGQTLTIDGTRPVIFAVTGNVQIDGTIRLTNAGAPAGCGNGGNGGGGGGAGHATAGAIGGAVGGNNAGAIGGPNGTVTLTPLRGGCKGGNGNATGGTGGAGGGSIQIVASGTISISATAVITAPGRGGNGGTSANASGGGGGSGGGILLEAPTVAITGAAKITANGGGGGGGEDGGNVGGNGGNGSETTAAGGTGGTAVATAGAGGAGGGSAAPVKGADDDNDGAGGGGGAVGRIRINATTCTVTTGQIISPAHTGTTCT